MYTLWDTATYNPHDAPLSFEELFSQLKGDVELDFLTLFLLESDTVLCKASKQIGISEAERLQGVFSPAEKRAWIILLYAVPELETAQKSIGILYQEIS